MNIVSGIICNKCGNTLPPHTEEEHFDINNDIHKCPHNKGSESLRKMKKNAIKFAQLLFNLEWTDDELLNLPEKYTNLSVHIALEKADNENEKIFNSILNGDGKYRRELLLKHIEKTKPVFTWNYA